MTQLCCVHVAVLFFIIHKELVSQNPVATIKIQSDSSLHNTVITSDFISNIRYNKLFQANQKGSTNDTKEGCFCREGTTLFNTVYDTCVTSCGKKASY